MIRLVLKEGKRDRYAKILWNKWVRILNWEYNINLDLFPKFIKGVQILLKLFTLISISKILIKKQF
jgi:hypothetical protein